MNNAIERAHKLLREQRKPQIVYRRNGKIAVISLQSYLDADMDCKGAKRICVVTKDAYGRSI